MRTRDTEVWLSYWLAALSSPHGVWIKALSGDLTKLKSLLYSARAQHYTPELASVEVRTSPLSPVDTLWLGRKGFLDREGT